VRNVKELFLQVVKRLLDERRDAVLAWENGEYFSKAAEHAQYELVAPGLYINMAWFPQYHLKGVQDLVDEFDLADDLLVKFASDEADEEVAESSAEREDMTDSPATRN
jgi:hypothetical protein